MLRRRASESPERPAYTFLTAGEIESGRLTWGELEARARGVAAALAAVASPGERALLLYPPGLDFVVAFFGCLYAGVVAVPAYPPRPNDRRQERLLSIVRDARPKVALATRDVLSALAKGADGGIAAALPELAALSYLATDELAAADETVELPRPAAEALAFLQYTSGSTSTPKGVCVTHGNLAHNERMIRAAFAQDEDSVVVGWLPLYHDMGLIGNVLQPLACGGRCVLMSPVAFLQRPRRWLEA
ncbi:MAG TPA: AMP-binding protein, partial [Thermoanaerobaculia bacterium]